MYVYDEQKIEKENRKRRLIIFFMNSLMFVILPIIVGILKINKNIISIWLVIIFGVLKFYLEIKKDFVNCYEKEDKDFSDFEETLRKEKLKKKIFYLKIICILVCLFIIAYTVNIFHLPSYIKDISEIRKTISNSKQLYVNEKKLENTEAVKKWILDSTNYFEILWDYRRTTELKNPKSKVILSNEKGQYFVIEIKESYGAPFIKMKENHYYKLGVVSKDDVDRTIEIKKYLGLIPQD